MTFQHNPQRQIATTKRRIKLFYSSKPGEAGNG